MLLMLVPAMFFWLVVQGNSSDMLRGNSSSLEADWEGSLLEGMWLDLRCSTMLSLSADGCGPGHVKYSPNPASILFIASLCAREAAQLPLGWEAILRY